MICDNTPAASAPKDVEQQLENAARLLSGADVESCYAMAYREFGQGRYEKALQLFRLLVLSQPGNKVFLLGTALCLRKLREYHQAAASFAILRLFESEEPAHPLAQAECLLLAQDAEAAHEVLEQVICYCTTHDGHDEVFARAKAILQLMEQRHEPADV